MWGHEYYVLVWLRKLSWSVFLWGYQWHWVLRKHGKSGELLRWPELCVLLLFFEIFLAGLQLCIDRCSLQLSLCLCLLTAEITRAHCHTGDLDCPFLYNLPLELCTILRLHQLWPCLSSSSQGILRQTTVPCFSPFCIWTLWSRECLALESLW